MEPAKKPAMSVGRLTVFFAITGMTVGIISGVVSIANIRYNIAAPLIALILFYASYKLTAHEKIKKFLVAPVEGTPGGKKVNVLMTGFWPHFIMWLIFWVLSYTLLVAR